MFLDPLKAVWKLKATFRVRLLPLPENDEAAAFTMHWLFCTVPLCPTVTDPAHPLQTLYLPPGHNAGWEYGHVHALHHFLDCVANNRSVEPYGATFEDGYRIQVIMKAIADSSASGRRIELAY